MNKARAYLAALVLTAMAGAAHAQLTVTPAVVSDYNWRGTTQSAHSVAPQLSVDWSGSGVHLGVWGSKIDFGPDSARLETDFTADYSFGKEGGLQYNSGIVYYDYPGHTEFAFPEAWFKVSKDWFSAQLAYSWDYFHFKESAWYANLNAAYPLAKTGFTLNVHYGYNFGKYFDDTYKAYSDYSLGVGYTLKKFNLSVAWVGNDNFSTTGDVFSNDSEIVGQISTTLPWGKE